MINHYAILGVSEDASQPEIKVAFKKLALRYHPDKNNGDPEMEERFKEVNQAYQVLSNPFEKARYDLNLRFGSYVQQEQYYPPPQPEAPRPSYRRRPVYKERQINWRENWIATGYAFAFTFVVAAIVMIGITIKNYIDAQNLKELLTKRREVFEGAKSKYKMGNVEEAIATINNMGVFMEGETDMESYKEGLLESFVYHAEHQYNRQVYDEAIYYYELIENYAPRNPLPLQEHLALAYREANRPHASLKKLTELLIANYRKMEIYLLMAEIWRDDLHDLQEAKRYFEIASDLAIERYKSIYGNAYPLLMKGEFLPREHYYIYTGLARVYLQTGEEEKAVKATRWNINMWPDSTENYVIAALGYHQLGQVSHACAELARARALGFADTLAIDCP